MTTALKDHWNRKYTDTPITELGWYESEASLSLQLIENCAVSVDSTIVDIGSGATTLIGSLLGLGYRNIYALDISEIALENAKALLSKEQAARVNWLVDDITHPSVIQLVENVAVWHDRALFHFLTENNERQTYHSLVQKVVAPGGFVIMAAFALNGATMCSSLPVERYSIDGICEFLGDGFKLVESLEYVYQMPSGDLRPYVYTRLMKI